MLSIFYDILYYKIINNTKYIMDNVYFSIHREDNQNLFDEMFQYYNDKIIIPEQSKDADRYFSVQDSHVILFIDDCRNPEEIMHQKLDEAKSVNAYFNGLLMKFDCTCVSGKSWVWEKYV